MKKFVVGSLALVLSALLISCGGAKKEETAAESSVVETESSKAETESAKETEKATEGEKTEVQVFVAASLKNVMEELGEQYEKENPSVNLVFQADSSGKLLSQIQELSFLLCIIPFPLSRAASPARSPHSAPV